MNWSMHWGQGILLGAVRGMMAERGVRGPVGSLMFMNLRLLNDQTLENATGVGAPPWTWPRDEQVIDLLHKGTYAFVTALSPTTSSLGQPVLLIPGRGGHAAKSPNLQILSSDAHSGDIFPHVYPQD